MEGISSADMVTILLEKGCSIKFERDRLVQIGRRNFEDFLLRILQMTQNIKQKKQQNSEQQLWEKFAQRYK